VHFYDRGYHIHPFQVADIFCVGCSSRLGWTYLRAYDPTQKYKEGKPQFASYVFCFMTNISRAGKYLIESERIFKDNAWELDDGLEAD
jgi:hypothetical protein